MGRLCRLSASCQHARKGEHGQAAHRLAKETGRLEFADEWGTNIARCHDLSLTETGLRQRAIMHFLPTSIANHRIEYRKFF
jgi:hypothetical protein